jgi:hypothetical protein
VDGLSTGRVFIAYLTSGGAVTGFSAIPGPKDSAFSGVMPLGAQFGCGVLPWKNGSLLVTSCNDGTVYVFNATSDSVYYTVPVDLTLFFFLLPILGSVCGCCMCIALFLWYFRRKPDEVEVLVLQSNIQIGKQRVRKKKVKKSETAAPEVIQKVYVEHYEM